MLPRVDTAKKPDHVGEGVLQGLNKLVDHVGDGAQKLMHKPQEGLEREGALGAAKGVGSGLLDFATGTLKGTCDLLGSTLEGVRSTPDALADTVNADRAHNKHGVEGEGRGDLLETFKEEAEHEPEHLGDGVMNGVQGLGRGLMSGWKDLTTKPMEGARESGVGGFALGAGKGLLGFAAKASSGTLDLATSVLSGAKNTPDAIERRLRGDTPGASSSTTGTSFQLQGNTAQPAVRPADVYTGQGQVLGSGTMPGEETMQEVQNKNPK